MLKGDISRTNVRKMTGNNPKLDHVNMNAYIKFGEIMSVCSYYIERKQHSCVNQEPYLWYHYAKNDL